MYIRAVFLAVSSMAMEFADIKTAMSTMVIGTVVIKRDLAVWISPTDACLSVYGSTECFLPRKGPDSRPVSVCMALMWLSIRKKSTGTNSAFGPMLQAVCMPAAGKINIFSRFSSPWSNRRKAPLCRILISSGTSARPRAMG